MEHAKEHGDMYNDRTTVKVILFSGILIVISITLIGLLVNYFAESSAVEKLKTKDLPIYAESIADKIDQRILKAEEVSQFLAKDSALVRWLQEEEQDETLQADALDKLDRLVKEHQYTNSFVVSAVTRHYWSEEGRIIDTVSEEDPDDSWFFVTIDKALPVEIDVDYNDERQYTAVFVNALIGTPEQPLGIAGVGFSLEEMTDYLTANKLHPEGRVWLIGADGTIDLSDHEEDNGKSIEEVIPAKAIGNLWDESGSYVASESRVTDFNDDEGDRMDLIVHPLKSGAMQLVVQLPRSYSTSHLTTTRWNTIFAIVVTILTIGFLFIYITRRLANPYKRALELNERLERLVTQRTRELKATNEALLDSIHYAKRIQVSLLPFESFVDKSFKEHFVLWQPRDVVGGDFYWVKETEHGTIIAVGDCTGHGVPGALMTMLAVSSLEQIVVRENVEDPSEILSQHHRLMQKLLGQGEGNKSTDDGLDLGICLIRKDGTVAFSGASMHLYAWQLGELHTIRGDKRGIGYGRTPANFEFVSHTWQPKPDTVFYMSTDGYRDQNGGDKNYSFGRQRFEELMSQVGSLPLHVQKERFEKALAEYQGAEPQRDDITVFAFRAG